MFSFVKILLEFNFILSRIFAKSNFNLLNFGCKPANTVSISRRNHFTY